MTTKIVSSEPKSANVPFAWLKVTLQSLVFSLKALPIVKWPILIGTAVSCMNLIIDWALSTYAPDLMVTKSNRNYLELATGFIEAGFDYFVVIPMIWFMSYGRLRYNKTSMDKKIQDQSQTPKIISAVLKTYGLTALVLSACGAVEVFVRGYFRPDMLGANFSGYFFWNFLAGGLSLTAALLTTYFLAVFLLAIPFALEGKDKVMRLSAMATKGYVWQGFGAILLSGGFFALIGGLIEWLFDFIPSDFDNPVNVVLAVLYMIVYASSILATIYIARQIQVHAEQRQS